MLLFGLQLLFQLRGTEASDFVSTEYTVDRATPGIRQWEYVTAMGRRISAETLASDWLAKRSLDLFDKEGDQERLTLDITMYSLLSYFGSEQRDWQTNSWSYRGSTGTLTLGQALSKDDECQKVTEPELRELLRKAGNTFADGENVLFGPYICLPPRTTVALTRDTLTIENPFCRISFAIALSGSMWNVKPKSRGEVPQAPQGGAQYQTRPVGIKIAVRYFGIRAQHADIEKYRAWVARVLSGAHTWFELPLPAS